MYLKQLKLKNYRLFSDIDISFQRGMNVLIGKNSSGKSSILEAIDFLLSPNNIDIGPEEIRPYGMLDQDLEHDEEQDEEQDENQDEDRGSPSVQTRIEGHFEMTSKEKSLMCSIFDQSYHDSINNSSMEIIFTKYIIKTKMKKRYIFDIAQDFKVKANGLSRKQDIMSYINGTLIPDLRTNNVIKVDDIENSGGLQELRPLYELRKRVSHQSSYLNQYLCNKLYEIKQRDPSGYEKILNQIKRVYSDVSGIDMDIEFNPRLAQFQIFFTKFGSGIKMPLKNEGAGIREFFYLFLTLYNFPSTVILKDEALTHLHKSLLGDFILAIDGMCYQMITTSHIKELIRTLDFGNIIVCRKTNGVSTAVNLTQTGEINTVLNELGYPAEDMSEIDALIKEVK
jgi:predicted ATP-dependent endonuclease of OLD family